MKHGIFKTPGGYEIEGTVADGNAWYEHLIDSPNYRQLCLLMDGRRVVEIMLSGGGTITDKVKQELLDCRAAETQCKRLLFYEARDWWATRQGESLAASDSGTKPGTALGVNLQLMAERDAAVKKLAVIQENFAELAKHIDAAHNSRYSGLKEACELICPFCRFLNCEKESGSWVHRNELAFGDHVEMCRAGVLRDQMADLDEAGPFLAKFLKKDCVSSDPKSDDLACVAVEGEVTDAPS